jgi:hypothetical protein
MEISGCYGLDRKTDDGTAGKEVLKILSERLLDGMLDFGFNAAMVRLYKKLCRYYFEIDQRATVSYVHAHPEQWYIWQDYAEIRNLRNP